MIRNVGGIIGEDAGAGRTVIQDDNPFDFDEVRTNIIKALEQEGFAYLENILLLMCLIL